MNKIVTIVLILISCLHARAKYESLALYDMVINAEKIVYGTIIEIDSISLTLKIDGSLTSDSGVIKVDQFKNWECASRWTKYQIGQQVLLFLTTWNGKLTIMSGGGEGELPILNNTIFINQLSIDILPTHTANLKFEKKYYNLYGSKFYGIKWDFKNFISSITFIRNCFKLENSGFFSTPDWKIKCSTQEVEQKATKSKLVRWVYEIYKKDENNK